MATGFDEMLKGESESAGQGEAAAAEELKPVDEASAAADQTTESDDESDEDDDSTAESEAGHGKQVPLAALKGERRAKQDYKVKAAIAEERAKNLETELERMRNAPPANSQQGEERQQGQPMTYEEALINERMNMSEMMVRGQHQDVDDKFAAFQELVKENPSLGKQLRGEKHPWDFMYRHAEKALALKEIGDDPKKYREQLAVKLRAEIMAELGQATEAQTEQPAAKPRANIPQSLATARSSAARSAPAFSGPTPLDQMLK